MNFVTIGEASRKTGIKQEKLRKAVRLGLISSYPLGNRRLVDLDTLPREVVSVENLIGVRELAELTGLSESAIRRGITEGWLPFIRDGNRYKFQQDDALEAIRGRMTCIKNEKK